MDPIDAVVSPKYDDKLARPVNLVDAFNLGELPQRCEPRLLHPSAQHEHHLGSRAGEREIRKLEPAIRGLEP
jgi:hypothetical protein